MEAPTDQAQCYGDAPPALTDAERQANLLRSRQLVLAYLRDQQEVGPWHPGARSSSNSMALNRGGGTQVYAKDSRRVQRQ
ncbi:hypothetical protein HYQ45_002325 [Verticillium longisporum]|uniref:Uncharacterized protein n=1 Tax=Verticillium longisporum TaxID=100787 RepID=A0A8I3AVU2_VERLO|nr:hypothetical protein HYQ45_002325 [Verticillium longisporum]